MDELPLSTALTTVLAAAVDGTARRPLLSLIESAPGDEGEAGVGGLDPTTAADRGENRIVVPFPRRPQDDDTEPEPPAAA